MTDREEIDLPHVLYRLRDAAGDLLYIGVTNNLGHRMKQHRRVQSWWGDVAKIDAELHPNREAVLVAEAAAILAEEPRWNVVGREVRSRPVLVRDPWDADPLDLARSFGVPTNLSHAPHERAGDWVHLAKDRSDPRYRKNAVAAIRRAAAIHRRRRPTDGPLAAPQAQGMRAL